jgi:catalase
VFEATDDISDLSRAAVFTKGEKTEVFVRFSTVTGGAGSVDTPRDVRGFAVKFYTAKAIGTLSATTFRCSSSRTRSSFPT